MVFIHASLYDSHALCTNCSEICSKNIDKIRKFEAESMCKCGLCIRLLNSISMCHPFVKQLLYFCHPLLNFPSSIFLKHIMILFHFPFIFSIFLSRYSFDAHNLVWLVSMCVYWSCFVFHFVIEENLFACIMVNL